MAPSTSLTCPPPETEADFDVAGLERFYGWQAGLYDWTRPAILFGRRRAVERLAPVRGERLLDVGCGTGFNLPSLAASGARVVGVECSPAMLQRARARVAARGVGARVGFDARPYGSHAEQLGRADGILFSYSLSMIPPYALVLDRAWQDLRPGGRVAVVDFLDACGPVGAWLTASHVMLGEARLQALRSRFRVRSLEIRRTGLWRFFLFVGDKLSH
jgi:S-adenosylmethionine-diacylgycerolhomoserine-N-methlytransferase